jgi:hypothetical protein
MEDLAIYGYVTPTRLRIVIAFALVDAVIKDTDVVVIFKSLHSAYYSWLANPFHRLKTGIAGDPSDLPASSPESRKSLERRVAKIVEAISD